MTETDQDPIEHDPVLRAAARSDWRTSASCQIPRHRVSGTGEGPGAGIQTGAPEVVHGRNRAMPAEARKEGSECPARADLKVPRILTFQLGQTIRRPKKVAVGTETASQKMARRSGSRALSWYVSSERVSGERTRSSSAPVRRDPSGRTTPTPSRRVSRRVRRSQVRRIQVAPC